MMLQEEMKEEEIKQEEIKIEKIKEELLGELSFRHVNIDDINHIMENIYLSNILYRNTVFDVSSDMLLSDLYDKNTLFFCCEFRSSIVGVLSAKILEEETVNCRVLKFLSCNLSLNMDKEKIHQSLFSTLILYLETSFHTKHIEVYVGETLLYRN